MVQLIADGRNTAAPTHALIARFSRERLNVLYDENFFVQLPSVIGGFTVFR